MNERIEELFEQAKAESSQWLGSKPAITITYDELEKFAELLIQQCIEQCSKALVEHTGQPSVTHNYAVGLCQDSIKEHFGVE